ncbi:TetR/AcrR family transcriptional regulator [Sinomonas sp. P47F7]|uniref:TetR/AcrR family transcriptional regulator n=1 Tax=Sinomonas sp. P47F7 TaxID=3410987 RepID=UPI003BF597CA
MPRWNPDARERLVTAALHLFAEHGYDKVTVVEIAERAGLTKSTFFRYFPDKRDVLAAGQETLSQLLTEGIDSAPADAAPLAAVGAGLERAAAAMTPFNRELGPVLHAAIAANAELQERNALKQAGLSAAMARALRERGVDATTAAVAAELGGLAFKEAYAAWIEAEDAPSLVELARDALDRLRATAARLA